MPVGVRGHGSASVPPHADRSAGRDDRSGAGGAKPPPAQRRMSGAPSTATGGFARPGWPIRNAWAPDGEFRSKRAESDRGVGSFRRPSGERWSKPPLARWRRSEAMPAGEERAKGISETKSVPQEDALKHRQETAPVPARSDDLRRCRSNPATATLRTTRPSQTNDSTRQHVVHLARQRDGFSPQRPPSVARARFLPSIAAKTFVNGRRVPSQHAGSGNRSPLSDTTAAKRSRSNDS